MKDFTPIPNRLVEEAESSAHLAVFVALAWHRSSKTGSAMPGVSRVANMARISKPTALLAINWLRDHKFLEIRERPGHRQGRIYRFPDLDETGQKEEPVKTETGYPSLPLFEETGQKEIPEPVKNKHPNQTKTKRKTIPSRDKREPGTQHAHFREATREYWESNNQSIEVPWDASEGTALSRFLKANPKLDLEAFKNLLRNRQQSDAVNHAERPRQWLGIVTNYAGGPLDRFGKPKGATDGSSSGTIADKKFNSVVASTKAAFARIDAMDFGEDRGTRSLTG
jgi:hypothetical protein